MWKQNVDSNGLLLAEFTFYEIEGWFIKKQTSDTSSDNECQRVVQRVTTNDTEWQRVVISVSFLFLRIREEHTSRERTL